MRISIFNRNNTSSYKDEYIKMIKELNSKCISFNKNNYTYFEFVNTHIFHNWKFRGTYLDSYKYLESIGVNINSKKITEDNFINFLEFLLNIQLLIESIKYYYDNVKYSVNCKSILFHNIPIILDSLGYQAYNLEDRVLISSKDIDYEDLCDVVPNDIYELLLSYKNINNNGIKMKRIILYKLYKYMESDTDKYRSYNSTVFSSIKTVVTKMGIIGDIDKKYIDLSNYKIRKYYDNCFHMMTFLIKYENILKYRDDIRNESIN